MSDEVPNPYNRAGKKITFYDALNDLKTLDNLDIYVTGSNSKMLSSDILTEFRGRSDEIRVHPSASPNTTLLWAVTRRTPLKATPSTAVCL